MALKTTRWDTTEYLTTAEDRAAYLEAALDEEDPAFFQHALGIVARAQGMQEVASMAHASRAGLYKALSSSGNPEFTTVYRVIDALGYRLALVSKKKAPKAAKRPSKRAVATVGPQKKPPSRRQVRT